MRFKNLIIAMAAMVAAIVATGCSSSQADDPLPQQEDYWQVLSRSDAQSQIDELVANNTYLDFDPTVPPNRHSRAGKNQVTEDQVICRVIAYRFFKLEAVENGRVVVKGTPEDINVSQRAFDQMMKSVNLKNQVILQLMSQGYSREDAIKKVHYITPESIEKVIKL
ncbi:MAG: hypothetical protein NC342_00020 [Pseudoflavonifractor sp.]|nr:hypothetical protein [Alloprevotella sp.]MCM1115913.1 hypothetical protein [Pseudoflavonifractor sp.]